MRLLVLALLLLPSVVSAQSVRHSEVLLYPSDSELSEREARAHIVHRLGVQGLILDHARPEATVHGFGLRTVLSETELARAQASGLTVDVLIPDLKAHYLATRSGSCEEGQGVSRIEADICGTMGGYLTLSAVVDRLNALAAEHPEIVAAPVSLGQSHEGRDIWMVEISDNPGEEEPEGEVLYTGVHHAREPGSMAAILYFMYYLVENYGSDPEVSDLVDNRRLFFVPIVNPDGYLYNEQTDPEGGGFWRKNRRDNGGNVFGVDLNRNYGYNWGYDNLGSSSDPDAQTYRGTEPFSEPETRAIRDFLEDGRAVSHAFNYHTYSELLLYPWGYEFGAFTPDDDALNALAADLTEANNYVYGTTWDVLYLTNGDAIDWMYGEQDTKQKILAYLPEVGYAFWPDPADVYRLADDNLEANLGLAQAASPPTVASETGLSADADGLLPVYPNPFASTAQVGFTLREAGALRLTVHDVLGREVAVLVDEARPAGYSAVTLDAAAFANGLYVVRMEAGGEVHTRPVTIVR